MVISKHFLCKDFGIIIQLKPPTIFLMVGVGLGVPGKDMDENHQLGNGGKNRFQQHFGVLGSQDLSKKTAEL